jgi:acetyl-CoA acetyltransferase
MLGNPKQKSGGVAIVGIADTDYGKLFKEQKSLTEPRNAYSLGVGVAREAIADAGLTVKDIDGVLLVRDTTNYEQFCYMLGVSKPRIVNILEGAGRQSGAVLQYAAMAILTGMAETVLITYSNNGKSLGATYGGTPGASGHFDYGRVHGMTSPGAQVGMTFNRYAYEFGLDRKDLSMLAISNHYNATLNPKAVFQKELTPEEYFASRYVAEPLHVHDYCLINDGAVAIVMTSIEKARTLKKPVVELAASSCRGAMSPYFAKEDFFYKELREVAGDVFETAKMTPKDIDCVQVYDNFTPTILYGLEGFGFCERGKAFEYLKENGSKVGQSKCPVNTSGTHTCESYMQGFNLIAECVRQCRHECGPRQVKDCENALYILPAAIITGHIFARR